MGLKDRSAPGLCAACPRECRAARSNNHLGYCQTGRGLVISSICLHQGEEPVLIGNKGMCNIFFSHCNLQCIYCQNYQISRNKSPVNYLPLEEVIARVKEMAASGVECVGFVSCSHMLVQMKEIILTLRQAGLKMTTVMNTNAYDKKEALASLADLIDVYLPDFKYAQRSLARTYSGAPDYPAVALQALGQMYQQKGAELTLKPNGTIRSGLIIRHLILPGHTANSKACLKIIARELSPDVHISLMAQYYPTPAVQRHPELGRRITPEEYAEVLAEFYRLGFHRGWVQELDSADFYRPDFSQNHPFHGCP